MQSVEFSRRRENSEVTYAHSFLGVSSSLRFMCLFRLPSHTMIPLKRKAAFSGQQTYRLNERSQRAQVRSQEQQLKRRRQNTERHSQQRMQRRVALESLKGRSAEEVVALARERYCF